MERAIIYISDIISYDLIDEKKLIKNNVGTKFTLYNKDKEVMVDIYNNEEYKILNEIDYNLKHQEYVEKYKELDYGKLTKAEKRKIGIFAKRCMLYNENILKQKEIKDVKTI